MADQKTPKGLGTAGRALWRSIAGPYQLRADELRTLEDAAREADLIERLEEAQRDAPLTVKGSQGQQVARRSSPSWGSTAPSSPGCSPRCTCPRRNSGAGLTRDGVGGGAPGRAGALVEPAGRGRCSRGSA